MMFVLIGNHANYSIDEEVSAEANISNVKSCPVGEIEAESLDNVKFQDTVETEHQHRKLVARQTESDAGEEAALAISRQSWTGWLNTVFTDIRFSIN